MPTLTTDTPEPDAAPRAEGPRARDMDDHEQTPRSRRLLIVTTSFMTVRAFLRPFAEHFRSQGWTVDAASAGTSTCEECRKSFDHVFDLPFSRNPLRPANLVTAPRMLRRLVAENGYQLVHTHTPVASFSTAYALRGLRKQRRVSLIYTAHGFFFHPGQGILANRLYRGLEGRIARWSDHLVVINQTDLEAARRFHFRPDDRIHYMPGIGVDTEFFDPAKVAPSEAERIRGELGLAPAEKLLLMVAEFNPGKRHRDLLEAFAALSRTDCHLAFAGEGPLKQEMQALAEKLGVQRCVHFLGYRRDIPALVRASLAVVLPSEREGLPRSVMESMSLEVPVIGTDIRGMRDLLADECGLLFAVGDTRQLAARIDWALDHPNELAAMGRRGRQKMADYDTKKIIAAHEALYRGALSEVRAAQFD